MGLDNANYAEMVVSMERISTVNYALVSSATLLVFDYFLTLPREIKLIWNTPWSCVKVLFLLNRYTSFSLFVLVFYTFIPSPDSSTCVNIINSAAWTTFLGLALADAILCIRTYAIWGQSRFILIVMVTAYTACITPFIGITQIYVKSLVAGPMPFGGLGCFLIKENNFIYAEFVCVLILETVIVILTFWKALFHLKDGYVSRTPLVRTLYRDGFLYYISVTTISLGNTIIVATAPTEYVNLLMGFHRVLHTILAGRVVLHIREMASVEDELIALTMFSQPMFPPREGINP